MLEYYCYDCWFDDDTKTIPTFSKIEDARAEARKHNHTRLGIFDNRRHKLVADLVLS
jgi:hypothetical protein